MQKMISRSAVLILLLASLCLVFSCSRGGAGAPGISSNAEYESQYRDQSRSTNSKSMADDDLAYSEGGESYGSAAAPTAPPGAPEFAASGDMGLEQQDLLALDGMDKSATAPHDGTAEPTDVPAGGGLSSKVEDWLLPKAWAQDHNIDDRYIVRTGNIEMEIEDFEKSAAEVSKVALRYNGIVTDSQMQKYGDDMRVGWVTLRVPGDKFQQCFEDLKALGEVKVQNISSEDVSTDYIAGISRMKSLTVEQQTLQGMLADAREIQRTRGLGEAYSVLLDTQARLSSVSTELQNVEDRVNALADRITRSTISVHLSERPLAPPPDEFAWGIGSAFENAKKDLLHGLDYTVSGIVYFLVNGLIWWIIWLGIFWAIWKFILRPIWLRLWNAMRAKPAEPGSGSKA